MSFTLPGSKTADSLKEKLAKATEKKDKNELEEVIKECVAAGMAELDSDIDQARNVLDQLKGGKGG